MLKNIRKDIKTKNPSRILKDQKIKKCVFEGVRGEEEEVVNNSAENCVAAGDNEDEDLQENENDFFIPEDDSDLDEPRFYECRFGGKTRYFDLATDEEQARSLTRGLIKLSREIARFRRSEQEEKKLETKAGDKECKS